jgi:hypothetical protein
MDTTKPSTEGLIDCEVKYVMLLLYQIASPPDTGSAKLRKATEGFGAQHGSMHSMSTIAA